MINIFKTKDLSEGALLLVKGQKLIQLERVGKTVYFVFTDKESCEQLSNQYWFGGCLVNAKSYFESIQTLKKRIFS